MLNIAADLLGAHEATIEFSIVNRRAVGSRVGRDLPAGLGEEVFGRFLEAALGQSEHQKWSRRGHAAKGHRASGRFKSIIGPPINRKKRTKTRLNQNVTFDGSD